MSMKYIKNTVDFLFLEEKGKQYIKQIKKEIKI